MAFTNCFLNFNINFMRPSFNINFGCFSMPNFSSFMPIFHFNNFYQGSFFQRYNQPFIQPFNFFNSFNSNINIPNFTSPNFSFNTNYTNFWQNSAPQIGFDTFEYTTKPIKTKEKAEDKTNKADKQTSKKKKTKTTTRNNTKETPSNYANMSKVEAEKAAKQDSNLEKLSGGKGWSVSHASFENDIPYAGNGINKFLDHLTAKIGENLVVTSALGTSTSPHAKSGGHYSATNPKLDFGGGLSHAKANQLKEKLVSTGYFTRVDVESDGSTAHIDVKIKDSVLAEFA